MGELCWEKPCYHQLILGLFLLNWALTAFTTTSEYPLLIPQSISHLMCLFLSLSIGHSRTLLSAKVIFYSVPKYIHLKLEKSVPKYNIYDNSYFRNLLILCTFRKTAGFFFIPWHREKEENMSFIHRNYIHICLPRRTQASSCRELAG